MEEVVISAYDLGWATAYETERRKLAEALSDIVLGIEHIGSTSVPGLPAKPVIDIMIGLSDLSQLQDEHKGRMSNLGYEFVDHPHFPERRFFRRGERRAGTHHLHMYKHNGDNWHTNLLFRNYLRGNPEAVARYGALKKELGERYKNDRAAYTRAKEPFIQEILLKAAQSKE